MLINLPTEGGNQPMKKIILTIIKYLFFVGIIGGLAWVWVLLSAAPVS